MLEFVLMPCARAMLGFAPVARRELPFSVPKNQYSAAMTATVKISSSGSGFLSDSSRT